MNTSNDVLSIVVHALVYVYFLRLCSLLERVLEELRDDEDGQLVTATLCLLHVSPRGLMQCELLQLLASNHITPPSPFDEKSQCDCCSFV